MTDNPDQTSDQNTITSPESTLNDSSAPTSTEQPVAPEVPVNQPTENVTDQPAVETPPTQESIAQEPVQPPASENPPENSQPSNPTPSTVETPSSPNPPNPSNSSPQPIPTPQLRLPFNGNYPLTFSFGAQAETEEMKKKFQEWGIIGHHGLDFALTEGTEVLAVDSGKIIQSGDNGDFGISITMQHPWGQSLYSHLKETKVNQDQEVQAGNLIGLSGQTGSAYGAHLHFGIKPSSPDQNNGYLGFIDPIPYLPQIPQTPQPPQIIEKEVIKEVPVEKIVEKEVIKEVPVETVREVIKEVPVVDDALVQQRTEEKLKTELEARRQKANEARQSKKDENLVRIEKLLGQKEEINNEDVRELLHVSQTSATRYLEALTNQGKIKAMGKGRATVYRSILN
ncbi:peptidoglycan DD-metalloendopeptidase family protein [Candidatus Gottesmanbacteria bacterium]|nr:peptidoglycan DD-metalloendopeptidase family protein [Candidatus Gottesmanbacteria bacterium]